MPTEVATRTYFVQECINCGISFGAPASWDAERRRDRRTFYCPNGHPQCYVKNIEQGLRDEITRLNARIDQKDAAIRTERKSRYSTERSLKATKGVVTKLKKRSAAGVCPCCNRTFKQLVQHMACKHPEFAKEQG